MRRSTRRNIKNKKSGEHLFIDFLGSCIYFHSVVSFINKYDKLYKREGVVIGATSSRTRIKIQVVVKEKNTYWKKTFTRNPSNLKVVD